jgi:hypothetical protein
MVNSEPKEKKQLERCTNRLAVSSEEHYFERCVLLRCHIELDDPHA